MNLFPVLFVAMLSGCDEKQEEEPEGKKGRVHKPVVEIDPRKGRLLSPGDGRPERKIKEAIADIVKAGEDITQACKGGNDECPLPTLTVDSLAALLLKVASTSPVANQIVDIFVGDVPRLAFDRSDTWIRLVDEVLEIFEIVGSHDLTEQRKELLLKSALGIAYYFKSPADAPSAKFLMDAPTDTKLHDLSQDIARLLDLQLDDATREALENEGQWLKDDDTSLSKKKAKKLAGVIDDVRKSIFFGHSGVEQQILSASSTSLAALAH